MECILNFAAASLSMKLLFRSNFSSTANAAFLG